MKKGGLLSKIALTLAGMTFVSGCYTHVYLKEETPRLKNHIYLLDSDIDGIPNIFDPVYNPPFYNWHYKHYPYIQNKHYYHSHQDKTKVITPKPNLKIKERSKETKSLRNNDAAVATLGKRGEFTLGKQKS